VNSPKWNDCAVRPPTGAGVLVAKMMAHKRLSSNWPVICSFRKTLYGLQSTCIA
jgi:hypothetical protein